MTTLKHLRLSKGMNQEQLASKAKVKRWKVALAERSLLRMKPEELNRLAAVLQFDPEKLLREVDSEQLSLF